MHTSVASNGIVPQGYDFEVMDMNIKILEIAASAKTESQASHIDLVRDMWRPIRF